ncbi:hypothetical protein L7Q78_45905, partial [Achromobacter xylosoxidans]|nr:hypothetical protein [Achromobacter xylosoxidans]
PVTNVADAFNLAAAGETRTGLQVLAPGARFSASMLLALQTPRDAGAGNGQGLSAIIRPNQSRSRYVKKLSTEQLQAAAETL